MLYHPPKKCGVIRPDHYVRRAEARPISTSVGKAEIVGAGVDSPTQAIFLARPCWSSDTTVPKLIGLHPLRCGCSDDMR
jgi:hypothetical protein